MHSIFTPPDLVLANEFGTRPNHLPDEVCNNPVSSPSSASSLVSAGHGWADGLFGSASHRRHLANLLGAHGLSGSLSIFCCDFQFSPLLTSYGQTSNHCPSLRGSCKCLHTKLTFEFSRANHDLLRCIKNTRQILIVTGCILSISPSADARNIGTIVANASSIASFMQSSKVLCRSADVEKFLKQAAYSSVNATSNALPRPAATSNRRLNKMVLFLPGEQ